MVRLAVQRHEIKQQMNWEQQQLGPHALMRARISRVKRVKHLRMIALAAMEAVFYAPSRIGGVLPMIFVSPIIQSTGV